LHRYLPVRNSHFMCDLEFGIVRTILKVLNGETEIKTMKERDRRTELPLQTPLRTVYVTAVNGLEISFYENSLFSVRLDGKEILKNRFGKQTKIFSAIAIKGKKYFIAIEKSAIGRDFKVSLYDTKKILFSTGIFEENDWNLKRLSLLNRKEHSKIRFGEIFLDNLLQSIISRLF